MWAELLADLLGQAPHRGLLDPRVNQVLQSLDLAVQLPPVEELADRVGLSVSRLQHLVRRDTGLSLQRWVLWRRVLSAMALVAQGHSMTRAAADSGFADGAHFTRSFTKFFAFPPTIASDDRVHLAVHDRLELQAA